MARQYNNKRSTRQKGGAPHQFLVVIVTFFLGYLTASLFDVQTISHWMNTQVLASHQEKQSHPAKTDTRQAQIPPKPKFEFYTLLANEKAGTAQSNVNHSPAHSPNTASPVTATQAASKAAVATAAIHPAPKTNVSASPPRVAVKVAEARPASATPVSRGAFLVQVASFKARQDAEHMKGMLILKGFNVNVVPVSQPARGIWYRVVVGPYSNRVLAQKAQETLARNERLRGMVTGAGA